MTDKNNMFERVLALLEKAIGTNPEGTLQEVDKSSIPIIKQFQDDEQVSIEWLFPIEQDDLHGERMDLEEARSMVDNLNKTNKSGKLTIAIDHILEVESITLEKAWINECECQIGDTLVPEGWPLAKFKFNNKELWKARKDGTLMGTSIGARGYKEEVEID